ncbi:MAG: DUF2911 domain-containing protein [Bacteroidota bacterium]
MKNSFTTITLLISILLASHSGVLGQEAIKPRPSPLAISTIKFEDSYLKITYSQPHKRGRNIFGELVPYGQVWRTGANEATEITITEDVMFGTDTLKAGTYSIFSIPEKDKWIIIVNAELGLWGSYNYQQKSDVMRFEVKTERVKDVVYEPFTIDFSQKNAEAEMYMMWDKTKVTIPIKFIGH